MFIIIIMKFEVTLDTDQYATGQIIKTFSLKEKTIRDENAISPNLSAFSGLIVEQLLKLYCYRDCSDYEYEWVYEIFRILHEVPEVESTGSYPSKRFLFAKMWLDDLDVFSTVLSSNISYLNSFEDFPRIICVDRVQFEQYCEDFYKWFCDILSRKGRVFADQIYDEVKSLLEKYPIGGASIEDKV